MGDGSVRNAIISIRMTPRLDTFGRQEQETNQSVIEIGNAEVHCANVLQNAQITGKRRLEPLTSSMS